MHGIHVSRRLEIMTARVETDALAYQRHTMRRARRFIGEVDDCGVAHLAPLRHCAKSAGAHFFELAIIEFLTAPAIFLRESFDSFAIKSGRQFVRRQYRELAA